MPENKFELLLVALFVLVCVKGGYSAAKRKGRRAKYWAVACGLFPFVLIVLEFLPSARAYNDPKRKSWPRASEWMTFVILGLAVLSVSNISAYQSLLHPNGTSAIASGSAEERQDTGKLFSTEGDMPVTPEASLVIVETNAAQASGGKISAVSPELITYMGQFHPNDEQALTKCAVKVGGMETHAFSMNTYLDTSKICFDETLIYERDCGFRFELAECRLAAQTIEILASAGRAAQAH